MIRHLALLAPLAALTAGACSPAGRTADAWSDTKGDARTGTCSPEAARRIAGSTAPGEAELKRQTGAGIVRRIAPGDPVTMDYNARRVTVEVDARGVVVRAACG